ncbi:Janus kinase and microtubule-interacting protein 1 [Plakobranchus ocellatus]|uniref:Janus kinase and microtubule-interacting protein 1 n=1 Tax=Plakobranchus ocellatus TaxID=259542 RepID=A0AAV4CGU0_9GAST|nr:Janus kinase and microtubule-interacting protein 1 [Plakobranchus ocellatus]
MDFKDELEEEEKSNAFSEPSAACKTVIEPSDDLDNLPVTANEIAVTTSASELSPDVSKLCKSHGNVPTVQLTSCESSPPETSPRRLSLQPDREVDQCRRRLSNVDISSQHRHLTESNLPPIQQNLGQCRNLSLSPKPPDGKPSRSPPSSRIPIYRSRSTPPQRRQNTSKQSSKHGQEINPVGVEDEITLQEEDNAKRNVGDVALSGKLKPIFMERGRSGPKSSGQDRRRASAATVRPPCVVPPRARRSLSFSHGPEAHLGIYSQAVLQDRTLSIDDQSKTNEIIGKETSLSAGGRVKDCVGSSGSSADSLRTLNVELRDQVTRLRARLDAQRGSIRQVQWQKVLDVRQARQQEQKRLWTALEELRQKLGQEKAREVEQMREHLTAKAESDMQKLTRHKDAEIFKLKQELISKESILKRVLNDERKVRLGLMPDSHKTKLLDELKALRQEKRTLEESLESASCAQRAFSDGLRKHSERRESEVSKVRREMQLEVKGLFVSSIWSGEIIQVGLLFLTAETSVPVISASPSSGFFLFPAAIKWRLAV